jgi:hypothetical protein
VFCLCSKDLFYGVGICAHSISNDFLRVRMGGILGLLKDYLWNELDGRPAGI